MSETQKGTIKVEKNVLIVEVPLDQPNAKIIAKGILLDAVNVVDQYFFALKQHRMQMESQTAASQKRVIDRIINPNGGVNGV